MAQIFISSQMEYNRAVKERLHLANELVLQNTPDFINVHTDVTVGKNGRCTADGSPPITITARENGIVTAYGKSTVIGHDNANIIAKDNCNIALHDSAFGNCFDHCHATLDGKAKITADGNCTLQANDESSVSASGSCKVYTCQKATAKGTDRTSLSGKNESTLTGLKNCTIQAKDSCIVYASEDCAVTASDSCLVVASSYAKITSHDNCLVMSNGKPDVSLSDQCEHVSLDAVTDKNIMGTLKQMAQTKAAMERPYAAIEILKNNIPPQRKEAVSRRLSTMGLKDQIATKNYLYSLIEAEPTVKSQAPAQNVERQLAAAHKAGYTQGVCECVAVVGDDHALGKKLLSEMHVTKDQAKKYASPETYKALEKGIFAQKQEQRIEQAQGVRR
jgi:hypothetical protein